MNEQERQNLFSELLASHRSELYGYIFAVVRNWGDSDDLFQAVCLVLWSKFDSFQPGTNFFAWARQTAKNKIHQYFQQKRKDDPVGENLLETLAEVTTDTKHDWTDHCLTALQHCRKQLAAADAELLDLHYGQGYATRQIADRLSRNQAGICRALNRIRRWLFECIQRDVARREHPRKG